MQTEWEGMPPGPDRPRFNPIAGDELTNNSAPSGGLPLQPFESVRLQLHGGRDRYDWPRYDAYNRSNKTVTEIGICLYAYDLSSSSTPASSPQTAKQLLRVAARLQVKIAPDEIATLSLQDIVTTALPAGTNEVVAEYEYIHFAGDTKASDDPARCPVDRAFD
jgi:hypothetical protein